MIEKNKVTAIVGASNNEEKFGYKVFVDLQKKGYNIIPINPKENVINGINCFRSLSDYDSDIHAVILIVPPKVTEKILDEVKKLGIRNVWMQPGSESDEAIKFCKDNSIELIHNSCIMLQ